MTAAIISLDRARQDRANRRLNSQWSDKIEEGRRIASERLNALLDDGDGSPPGGHAA